MRITIKERIGSDYRRTVVASAKNANELAEALAAIREHDRAAHDSDMSDANIRMFAKPA